MILPDDDECIRVLKELRGDPALTEWQDTFVESNIGRLRFSDQQKEIIAELAEKFET